MTVGGELEGYRGHRLVKGNFMNHTGNHYLELTLVTHDLMKVLGRQTLQVNPNIYGQKDQLDAGFRILRTTLIQRFPCVEGETNDSEEYELG